VKNKSLGDSLEAAREYAFLLLKYRLRSKSELAARLKNKKFSDKTVEATLRFLEDKKFIDDEDFTRLWIASRLKKPLGMRRIARELRLKGISGSTLEKHAAALTETYSEEKAVDEIIIRRMAAHKNEDPQKAKRRLYAYLLRRGFSPDIVTDALAKVRSFT
jgi:regulatory protein